MDKKLGVGHLHCKVCGQNFQSSINALSAPVDVYSEWIDACEAVATQEKEKDRDFIADDVAGEAEGLSDVDEGDF